VSSLKVVAHAAAPCPPEVKRGAIDWLGPIVNEYYGGTETGAVVSCTSEEWLAHPGTVGSVLPGCEVRILGEDGSGLPAGEPGDIYLINRGWGDFRELRGVRRARLGVRRGGGRSGAKRCRLRARR